MEIYLIRHTSVDVPPGTCYGITDVPLKDTFEAEAAVVRSRLEGLHFDCVYTSPLSRAARLAAWCGYPDAVRDDRLREMNMGQWEMQAFDSIADERLEQWYDDYLNVAPTGGESFSRMYDRVSAFLDGLRARPCRRAAVFAHGGVLVCARIYAGQVPMARAIQQLPPYGGIVRIDI